MFNILMKLMTSGIFSTVDAVLNFCGPSLYKCSFCIISACSYFSVLVLLFSCTDKPIA